MFAIIISCSVQGITYLEFNIFVVEYRLGIINKRKKIIVQIKMKNLIYIYNIYIKSSLNLCLLSDITYFRDVISVYNTVTISVHYELGGAVGSLTVSGSRTHKV